MDSLHHAPKVTVLMTVFNGSKYIRDTIDSVLSQTFDDFEFLIIDDCSIDNSVEIIKSYDDIRIRFIKNEKNMGQPSSLNIGLKLAKGEYIARIDQDDVCNPNRLEKQVKSLNSNLEVAVVGSYFTHIDSDGNLLYYKKLPVNPYSNLCYIITGKNPLIHPGVMYRKKVIEAIGGYREEYMPSEDIDLWLRLYQNGYVCENIPEYLTKVRIHEMQISKICNNVQEKKRMLAFFNFYKSVTKQNIDYHKIEQYFNVLVLRIEKVSLNNVGNIVAILLNLLKKLKWSNKNNNSIYLKFYDIRLFQMIGLVRLVLRSNIFDIIRNNHKSKHWIYK
jgi:glycosyltransferase involved in cell wall biosynthesis